MSDLHEDPPHDPLSISQWTHEDRQLAARERWGIDFSNDGVATLTLYWIPGCGYDNYERLCAYIVMKAEQGSALHLKARHLLAAQMIKDAAANRLT